MTFVAPEVLGGELRNDSNPEDGRKRTRGRPGEKMGGSVSKATKDDENAPLLSGRGDASEIAGTARCNVLIFMFVTQFGTSLFGALRAVYTDQVLHASDPVATATYALVGFFLFHAMAMPVLGKLSDSLGRKPLALLGVTTQAAVFATTASTVTPEVFIVAFCVLGVLDGSYTMMQLVLVDTSAEKLKGPVFRALILWTKFQDDDDDDDSDFITERRIGALFSIAWITGLVGSVIGVGFATFGSIYVGIRVSLLLVAGFLIFLDAQLALALPETRDFQDDEKKSESCMGMIGDAIAEQAAGFRMLFATPRRRTLLLASFFEHAAASGALSLIMYWMVFKFGFGVAMQAVVSLIALVVIAGGLIFLQGYLIEVAPSSEIACACVIAASLPFWALLGVATNSVMALVGVPAVATIAVFPELRALLTADLDRHQQGFVQGALTSLNAVADISGSLALLVTFEYTADDDVPHDSHRSNSSYKANLIWFCVFAIHLVVVAILANVPPHEQDHDSGDKKKMATISA